MSEPLQSPQTPERMLTTKQFAELAGCSIRVVYRWLSQGRIQAHYEGFKRLLIAESELAKARQKRPLGPKIREVSTPEPIITAPATPIRTDVVDKPPTPEIHKVPPTETREARFCPFCGGMNHGTAPCDFTSAEEAADKQTPPVPPKAENPEVDLSIEAQEPYKKAVLDGVMEKFGGQTVFWIEQGWKSAEDEALNFALHLIPGIKPEHVKEAIKLGLTVELSKKRASIWIPTVLAKYQP